MQTLHIGKYAFAPGLLTSIVSAVLTAALLSLGFWQLHRADEKQALQAAMAERGGLPPLQLDMAHIAPDEVPGLMWRRVVVHGAWDSTHQLLLDNQVVGGQAGYAVYTPLQVDRCACALLVNRGWVPVGASRAAVPDVAVGRINVAVSGIVVPVPAPGFGAAGGIESHAQGMLRLQRIDLPMLSARLGRELPPFVVRLDPEAPDGFRRAAPQPDMRPERHIAYAGQWFLLAALVVAVFVKLNLVPYP
jgi:surfeit locus 1 family protein